MKKRLNSTFLRIQISGQRLVLLKSEKVKVYIESIALSPENLIWLHREKGSILLATKCVTESLWASTAG